MINMLFHPRSDQRQMPGLWSGDDVVSMGPQFPVIWIMKSVNIAMLLLLTLILAALF